MKKATTLIAAATLALSASTAVAGSYTVPAEEDEVIVVANPGSSVGSAPLALAGLLIVGLAVAASGGSN